MKRLVMLVAALGVAVVLSACGSSGTSGEAARMIAGQVADYSGPAGVLEASNGSGEPMSVGTGSIGIDGSFRFELDSSVSESALYSPMFEDECTSIEVSNSDVKLVGILELLVVSDDNVVGQLDLTSEDPNSDSMSYTEVSWIYADRDTTVRGTCEYSDDFGTDRDTYNLNLESGWNLASLDYSYDASNNLFEFNFYNGRAANVEWLYSEYN